MPDRAMAMTMREMSDRLEIQSNVWDYSNAIDLHAWDLLDGVFLPDAEIFYGSVTLRGPAIKDWLRETLTRAELRGYCHVMLEPRITVTGDSAESLTRCINPMEATLPDRRRLVRYHFAWYRFEHARVADGWRIRRRLENPHEAGEVHWQPPPFSEARARPPLPYREA
jgi:hypothetical protein